ncbi:hypothetical protein M427DRAFT_59753 [Gonapodya prolifera JEL478]|uniref:Xylanolytic transcriptional activator regulatory domain-containing protein n=1 Tax=Gonapodya prolifera (strain JEL478) TaxID=1344416 RepID=A0A139A7B9_GONPJ|nr:hypothetical protein M427DRAFT_59753 [Gonapodya prolifera JEL478]|eukprot:KXS12253.1 hypothetical protein M427DRAFT_59753 [Gonapodya prolifera JEL478]
MSFSRTDGGGNLQGNVGEPSEDILRAEGSIERKDGQPVKRKRGRPRKEPLPDDVVAALLASFPENIVTRSQRHPQAQVVIPEGPEQPESLKGKRKLSLSQKSMPPQDNRETVAEDERNSTSLVPCKRNLTNSRPLSTESAALCPKLHDIATKVSRPDISRFQPMIGITHDKTLPDHFDLSGVWSEVFSQLRNGRGGTELFSLDTMGNLSLANVSVAPQRSLRPFIDKHLANVFLEHFRATLPIFHSPTFVERLASKPRAFIHAVYAFAARHSGHAELAEGYFELAKREVQQRIFDQPQDLNLLQTLIILAYDLTTNGQLGAGLDDMWTSICVSMAAKMKLMQALRWENGLGRGVSPKMLWREEEERRRTFWAVYWLDGYIGILTQRMPYIDESMISVPLPCDDFHWSKVDPDPIPSNYQHPPFEAIPQGTSLSLFSAVIVFVYFMNKVTRFVLGDHGNGATIERDFRSWYGLDPDVFLSASPSGIVKTGSSNRTVTLDTLRVAFGTLVCYHHVRGILFSKLAPELVLQEALTILKEFKLLLGNPDIGSGCIPPPKGSHVVRCYQHPIPPNTYPTPSKIRSQFDAKFPFFFNGLVFSVRELAKAKGVAAAMEDLQLILDVADGLVSKGWGMAKLGARELSAIAMDGMKGAKAPKQESPEEWLDSYIAETVAT